MNPIPCPNEETEEDCGHGHDDAVPHLQAGHPGVDLLLVRDVLHIADMGEVVAYFLGEVEIQGANLKIYFFFIFAKTIFPIFAKHTLSMKRLSLTTLQEVYMRQ